MGTAWWPDPSESSPRLDEANDDANKKPASSSCKAAGESVTVPG